MHKSLASAAVLLVTLTGCTNTASDNSAEICNSAYQEMDSVFDILNNEAISSPADELAIASPGQLAPMPDRLRNAAEGLEDLTVEATDPKLAGLLKQSSILLRQDVTMVEQGISGGASRRDLWETMMSVVDSTVLIGDHCQDPAAIEP